MLITEKDREMYRNGDVFVLDIDVFDFLLDEEKDNNKNMFANCTAFKAKHKIHKDKYIIFHHCTKQNTDNKYQVSFFDRLGAIMDFTASNIEDLAEKSMEYRLYTYYDIEEVIQ